jgi:alpha-beta hydrolase superfamily lysophospholipase
MPAPFNAQTLAALRLSVAPFAAAEAMSSEMAAFGQFYGIDFERQIDGVEHRVGSLHTGDHTVVMHQYLCPGATSNLLLLHGYLDHCGMFGYLIEYGLKRGSNVLIFDYPGHGLSTGEPAVIDDFQEYSLAAIAVLAAAQLPSLPYWTMAQSTGCSVMMELARAGHWPFSAAVMLAPLVRVADWRFVLCVHSLFGRFIDGKKRTFSVNSSNSEFLAFQRADPLQSHRLSMRWIGAWRRWLSGLPLEDIGMGPVLVVQGDRDGTVAWKRNMKDIPQLIPHAEIYYLAGAGHQLANESGQFRARYMEQIDQFLGRQMPQLP